MDTPSWWASRWSDVLVEWTRMLAVLRDEASAQKRNQIAIDAQIISNEIKKLIIKLNHVEER